MSKDLDAMKDRLTDAFNSIMGVAEEDLAITSVTNRTLASDLFRTAAVIAQTVAGIEEKQTLADVSARVQEVEELALQIGQIVAGDSKERPPEPRQPTVYPPRK